MLATPVIAFVGHIHQTPSRRYAPAMAQVMRSLSRLGAFSTNPNRAGVIAVKRSAQQRWIVVPAFTVTVMNRLARQSYHLESDSKMPHLFDHTI
jgi:hypothetical protein